MTAEPPPTTPLVREFHRGRSVRSRVLSTVMNATLEHHMALAYGDHRAALEGAAAALGIPVIEL